MGRSECNNVDRRDGRSEGNSTVRRLRRRLWKPGRADGEWANQRAGCQPSTLTSTVVPFQGGLTALARSGEHLCHQHLCESRAQGLVSGMEEVLPKNISNYLGSSGSQRAGVIYIVRAGR